MRKSEHDFQDKIKNVKRNQQIAYSNTEHKKNRYINLRYQSLESDQLSNEYVDKSPVAKQ